MRWLLVLVVAVAHGAAAELVMRDLRLAAVTRPTDFSYTLTAPGRTEEGDDAFEDSLGIDGGVRWSLSRAGDPVGLVLGADLSAAQRGYLADGALADMGAHASAGIGWALGDDWTVLAEAGAGYGLSTITLPATVNRPAWDASGTFLAYDARAVVQYALSRRLVLGLAVGWRQEQHDLSGDGADLTVSPSGLTAGLELVWRWSDAPPTLE